MGGGSRVAGHACNPWVASRQEAGPGGGTDRSRRIKLGEPDTVRGEAIHGRGLDVRGSVAPCIHATLIVGHDHDHVGMLGCGSSLVDRGEQCAENESGFEEGCQFHENGLESCVGFA